MSNDIKFFCKTISLIVLMILAKSVSANEGSGGNGGQGIYNGTSIQLRDLVQKNNCIWKLYSTIEKNYPTLKKVLNRIGAVDPVFKYQIEKSFNNVSFCFTQKKLIPLNYNNSDDLYDFPNDDFFQVAIYDDKTIFISLPYFNKMDEHNKSYTLLHEISHTFYNLDEQLRSEREPRLRQFIMNIEASVDELSFELLSLLIKQADFRYVDRVDDDSECYIDGDQFKDIRQYVVCVKKMEKIGFRSSRFFELKKHYNDFLLPEYKEKIKTNGYENTADVIAAVEPFVIRNSNAAGVAASIFRTLLDNDRRSIPYTDFEMKEIYKVLLSLNISINIWWERHRRMENFTVEYLNVLEQNFLIFLSKYEHQQQRCQLVEFLLYTSSSLNSNDYQNDRDYFFKRQSYSDHIPTIRTFLDTFYNSTTTQLSMSRAAPINDALFYRKNCLTQKTDLKGILNKRHYTVQKSRLITRSQKKVAARRTRIICDKMIGEEMFCKQFI